MNNLFFSLVLVYTFIILATPLCCPGIKSFSECVLFALGKDSQIKASNFLYDCVRLGKSNL